MSTVPHRFTYPIEIKATDIDSLKHVNNEVYLRWLIEAAIAHSAHLGYTWEKFMEMGSAFVVRRHELDYRLPAYAADSLRVETWNEKFEGPRGIRRYEIIRASDNRTILNGMTTWVFVDLKTGRPQTVPQEMQDRYLRP